MDRPKDLGPIIEQYNQGTCPRVIGAQYGEFGVTSQTIRNWLKEAGVKLRSPGGHTGRSFGKCGTILRSIPIDEIVYGVKQWGYRGYSNKIGVHDSCLHLYWRNHIEKRGR